MKKLIAVPTANKSLCAHFGHCQEFAVVETENQKILNVAYFAPPLHEPGTYPRFLAEKGVSAVIAGGMGMKAQDIFKQNKIDVFYGVETDTPENLVAKYLDNSLVCGTNLCDH
jgi:predicted Fe-Mo cluster-binding NifX family protein